MKADPVADNPTFVSPAVAAAHALHARATDHTTMANELHTVIVNETSPVQLRAALAAFVDRLRVRATFFNDEARLMAEFARADAKAAKGGKS